MSAKEHQAPADEPLTPSERLVLAAVYLLSATIAGFGVACPISWAAGGV